MRKVSGSLILFFALIVFTFTLTRSVKLLGNEFVIQITNCDGVLSGCEGKVLSRVMKRADFVLNHVMANPFTHPRTLYVLDGSTQHPVYHKKPVKICDRYRIEGMVIKVTGPRNYKAYHIISSIEPRCVK